MLRPDRVLQVLQVFQASTLHPNVTKERVSLVKRENSPGMIGTPAAVPLCAPTGWRYSQKKPAWGSSSGPSKFCSQHTNTRVIRTGAHWTWTQSSAPAEAWNSRQHWPRAKPDCSLDTLFTISTHDYPPSRSHTGKHTQNYRKHFWLPPYAVTGTSHIWHGWLQLYCDIRIPHTHTHSRIINKAWIT